MNKIRFRRSLPYWRIFCCLPLILLLVISQPEAIPEPAAPLSETQALVFSAADDPYAELAREIAAAEGLALVGSLEEALVARPEAIVWVAAPASLSDPVMAAVGRALCAAGDPPALGILTGASVESARALWQRAQRPAGQGNVYAVNAEYPAAGVFEGRILRYSAAGTEQQALSVPALTATLQQAGYLTFTGHGASRTWKLDPSHNLEAVHVPELNNAVIGTASCQTLRPWQEESIALAFVERGAAAYAGFVFSPNEGYLIGEFDGLPFRYTWPDFPLGMVVRVQSRGGLQGYAQFPYYFLIGDPRLSLNEAPAYRLESDRQADGLRTLVYRDAPAGILPLRIANGAAWQFVEIAGGGATADGERFYNAHLQSANLNGDKYILFQHEGGDFTLRLRREPPLGWRLSAPLLSAFDYVTLITSSNGGGEVLVGLGAIVWLVLGWRWRRGVRRQTGSLRPAVGWRALVWTALPVLVLVAALGVYAWVRVDGSPANSKPLLFAPFWLVGSFLLAWAGALVYSRARGRAGKLVAVGLALLPILLPAGVWAVLIVAFNWIFAAPVLGSGLYNLHNTQLGLLAAALELPLWLLAFSFARGKVSAPPDRAVETVG